MGEIISVAIGELSGIVESVFRSLVDDLLFPTGPKTIEEQLSVLIKGKNSKIIDQSGQIVYQTGVIRNQAWQNSELQNLLTLKDKEIRFLQDEVKSLEFKR